MQNQVKVRLNTVKLIGRILMPIAETGSISVPELNTIMTNLKFLAEKGELLPPVTPRLIDQTEAGQMLGISLASFKRAERDGAFPFKRRMVGSSVRYRITDVIQFVLAEEGQAE